MSTPIVLTIAAVWGGVALLLFLCDYLKKPEVEIPFMEVFPLLPCSAEHIIATLGPEAKTTLAFMERWDMVAVDQGHVTITRHGEGTIAHIEKYGARNAPAMASLPRASADTPTKH